MHKELIDKLCPGCQCETEVVYDQEGNPVCICTKCHMDEYGTILEVCDCCYEYSIECACVKCEECEEPLLFCNCKKSKIKKKPSNKIEIDKMPEYLPEPDYELPSKEDNSLILV